MTARLPIAVAPAPHETVTSYVSRLATLHGTPFSELWPHVSRLRRHGATTRARVVDAELLAAVTGRPVEALRRTLFELRQPEPDWWSLRHEPQNGCPRCDARHPGGTVLHVFPHHRYVCVRHQIWIGPPDLIGLPLPNLDALPEVVAAQRAHLRLLHRLGPAATFDAVLTAFLICGHLWSRLPENDAGARTNWQRRLDLLIPPENEDNAFSTSRLFAATYPEAVKLAALIGALHWRRLAAGTPDQQRSFTAEVARRLNTPAYRPRITDDPIAHWMDADCWQPPSLPAKSYNTSTSFGGSTPRKVPTSSHERHKKAALWFSRGRPSGKAGNVMISHRHLQPVLIRDWAPHYEFYVGHIHESTSSRVIITRATAHPRLGETTHNQMEEYFRPEPQVSDYLATATTPVPWHTAGQRLLKTSRPLDQRPRR